MLPTTSSKIRPPLSLLLLMIIIIIINTAKVYELQRFASPNTVLCKDCL